MIRFSVKTLNRHNVALQNKLTALTLQPFTTSTL